MQLTPPSADVQRVQRWFLLALCLLFLALSIQYTLKVTSPQNSDRSAFLRWRNQLLDLDEGVDIYARYNYPNPPIMALLLEPLAELPPLVGSLTWFYLKVGMAIIVFWWAFQLVETPDRPFPLWGKGLVVLLSLRPIMGDLMHGNVNLFILFLVAAALVAYQNRRDFLAGLLLALAIACKVTPALFVPYFLWKRSWKTLLGCLAGLVLFLLVIPGLSLGFEKNAGLLGNWYEKMVEPYLVQGEVTPEHNNQSLPGLLYRLLSHKPSFTSYVNDIYTPKEFHNIVDLDPAVLRWILKGCMLVFALLVIWVCRTPPTERQTWLLAAEFAMVLLGMLLFSERTWKHHCVTLVVPFTVLAYYLSTQRPGPVLRWYLVGTLAAVVVLMSTTSTGLFPGQLARFAKLAQVYGAYVWAYVLLLAALFTLLRQARSDGHSFSAATLNGGAVNPG